MLKKRQRGFSLIELVVVMSIIVLLSGVGFVSYTNANKATRDSKRKTDLEQIRSSLEFYRTEIGNYPANLTILESGGYLTNASSIVDPKTNAAYDYNLPPDPSSTNCASKQYEVCAELEVDNSDYCVCNP